MADAVEGLKPVYLVTGSDGPKVALALRRLRARFPAGAVEEAIAGRDGVSGEDVVASLNALGLFGGERLVLVREIDRWKADDVAAIASYLELPAPGSVLALVGEPPKAGALEAACAAAGNVLRYDVPLKQRGRTGDYPAWVRKQFELAGLRVDHQTARTLVAIVGEDAFALQTEVEKLVTWAAGDEVGPTEVAALAVPAGETSDFALADAWGARDTGAALAAAEVQLEREQAFVLALRLAAQVGRARTAGRTVAAGGSLADVMKALDAREYPAKKAISHADRYSSDELDAAAIRLARLDHDLKGASRLPADLELTRAIVAITGGERR